MGASFCCRPGLLSPGVFSNAAWTWGSSHKGQGDGNPQGRGGPQRVGREPGWEGVMTTLPAWFPSCPKTVLEIWRWSQGP